MLVNPFSTNSTYDILDVGILVVTWPEEERDMQWAMVYSYLMDELKKREVFKILIEHVDKPGYFCWNMSTDMMVGRPNMHYCMKGHTKCPCLEFNDTRR
jgi:hypothetical protein